MTTHDHIAQGWSRDQMALRAAQELQDGYYVNLGIGIPTLVANHVPCNARIIGTHEHESHFVFDILHNNTTDIQLERHSTDTHGTNHCGCCSQEPTAAGVDRLADPFVRHPALRKLFDMGPRGAKAPRG